MAIGANAGDGFLADITALRETNRSVHPPYFLGEIGIVDVGPVNRSPGFDTQRVVGFESRRSRPSRDERSPHGRGAVFLAQQVISEQPKRFATPKLAINPGDSFRHVLKLEKLRQLVLQRAREHFPRLWPGEVHLRQVMRTVRQFDLFGNEIAVQMVEDLFAPARPCVQAKRTAVLLSAAVNNDESGNLRLSGGQECLTAAAGWEILYFVRTQIMQKSRGVGFPHFCFAVVANVEQGGAPARTIVFRGYITILARHVPAEVLTEDSTFPAGRPVQWGPLADALSHGGTASISGFVETIDNVR
jgi:hypothetical protein